jgi:hypothetical protein
MKRRGYEADYAGIRYTAITDARGNTVIMSVADGALRTIPAKAARLLIEELEAVAGPACVYGDYEINIAQHYLLERAYQRAA